MIALQRCGIDHRDRRCQSTQGRHGRDHARHAGGCIWCRQYRPGRRAFSQTFDRIVRRAPVPVIRLHDLRVRHTHGTILIANGVHAKVVSERLGHAWFAFTVETYQHVLPGMQADAARVIEALLAPAASENPALRKVG